MDLFSLSSKKRSKSRLNSDYSDSNDSTISSGVISAPNTNPNLNYNVDDKSTTNKSNNGSLNMSVRSPTLQSFRSSSSIDGGKMGPSLPNSSSLISGISRRSPRPPHSDSASTRSARSSQFSSFGGDLSEAGPSRSFMDFGLGTGSFQSIDNSPSFNSSRSHSSMSSMSKVGTSGMVIKNVESLSKPEVEEHFEILLHSIAPGDAEIKRLRALPLDNKKALLQSSSLKQKQAQKRHGRAEKSTNSSPRTQVGHADDPPQAYIRKFLSGNVVNTDVAHLSVSLRTMPIEWLREFIELRGSSVLANVLHTINHRSVKREGDATLEAEILKCMRHVVNHSLGASDVSSQPATVASIAASIMSPQLQTRKQAAEILIFLTSWDKPHGHSVVLKSFDALQSHYDEISRFDAWLKAFEATIDGRGRMGSLVGASDELKNAISADTILVDYAVHNLLLINQIVEVPDDSDVRLFLRSQLEMSGLKKIMDKLRNLQNPRIDEMIYEYEELAEDDNDILVQSQNNQIFNNLTSTEDVFKAVLTSVEGSRGKDFFHATLQHLLLLPNDAETRTRYLQLVDSLISSVVMDKKGGVTNDFSSIATMSVGNVISRFTDQDRMQKLEYQLESERAQNVKTRRQKDALEQELALYNATDMQPGVDTNSAVVATLQRKLTDAEESLKISREAMHKVQEKSEEMEDRLREKISELEALIRELFELLKQTKGFHDLLSIENEAGTDGKKIQQREFITELEKRLARHKTVRKLEGTKALNALNERDDEEQEELIEPEPKKLKSTGATNKKWGKNSRGARLGGLNATLASSRGRDSSSSSMTARKSESHASQFMDAEDEEVQEHYDNSIAQGSPQLIPVRPGPEKAKQPSPRTLRSQDMPKDDDVRMNLGKRRALMKPVPTNQPGRSSKRISSDSAVGSTSAKKVDFDNQPTSNYDYTSVRESNLDHNSGKNFNRDESNNPVINIEKSPTPKAKSHKRQSSLALNVKPAYLDEIRKRGRRTPSGVLLDNDGNPVKDNDVNIHSVEEDVKSDDEHSDATVARGSGFTTQSDDTQVTSMASTNENNGDTRQNPFEIMLQQKSKNLKKSDNENNTENIKEHSDASNGTEGDSKAVSAPPPAPPPPPPPPPPVGYRGLGALQGPAVVTNTPTSVPAPPPPPPPPPPPGVAGTPNASLANVLKSGGLRERVPATNTGIPPPPPPPSRPQSAIFPQMRKEMPLAASQKMKQLQWDKINQNHLDKTVWGLTKEAPEMEWMHQLKRDGVWIELEEDFKSKQMVLNLMTRKKEKDLISVLDPQTQKRIEIVMQRVKQYSPEQIAAKILSFDEDFCTQTFLSELKPVLPTPEQTGKLAPYKDAGPEVLITLHPADRLMVQLIKIDRMEPRIEGMLYKSVFEEVYSILSESTDAVHEASENLMDAPRFIELLKLILLIGNYMNASGIKGGAFGFKITSLNKMVDTKSTNGTTLVHFLERTVAKHFPEMEIFLDELSKPADTYRVNLTDVRKGLGDLREGLKRLKKELEDNFSDNEKINPRDGYPEKMWKFSALAKGKLDSLVDRLALADASYQNTARFYGELDKLPSTSEFFGVFKQFLTSYKKCKNDNQTFAEEKASIEKRRIAKEQRAKERAAVAAAQSDPAGESVMDNLLEKLKQGDNAPRRRNRRGNRRSSANHKTERKSAFIGTGGEAAMAADMLASLQRDGFLAPFDTSKNESKNTAERKSSKLSSTPIIEENDHEQSNKEQTHISQPNEEQSHENQTAEEKSSENNPSENKFDEEPQSKPNTISNDDKKEVRFDTNPQQEFNEINEEKDEESLKLQSEDFNIGQDHVHEEKASHDMNVNSNDRQNNTNYNDNNNNNNNTNNNNSGEDDSFSHLGLIVS